MSGLAEYIKAQRGSVFQWGANDCLNFVSGALRVQGRPELPAEWLGGYSTAMGATRHYKRLLRSTGHSDIIEAMDARYDRAFTLHPADGTIAARPVGTDVLGYAFGVAYLGAITFLTNRGAMTCDAMAGDLFWA